MFFFFCAFDKSCITFFSSSNREKVHTYIGLFKRILGELFGFCFLSSIFCVCESKLYSFDLLINELCIYSKPNHMNEKYKPLLQILHVNSLCIRQLKSKYFPKWQKWCSKRFFKYIIHRSMKVHLTYNIKIIFSTI